MDTATLPEPSTKVESVSVSQLGALDLPTPNENAIQAAAGIAPDVTGGKKVPRDRNGRAFDPKIHQANADGSPVTRTDGMLMIRPECRRKLNASYVPPAPPAAGPSPSAAAGSMDASPEVVAPGPTPEMVSASILNPAMDWMHVWLGDEWKFEKAERENYVRVGARLAMKYNVQSELPPEVELLGLVGASIAHRRELPETKKRLEGVGAKLRGWWDWIRGVRPVVAKPVEKTSDGA